jgi:hypothetical protein
MSKIAFNEFVVVFNAMVEAFMIAEVIADQWEQE